MARLLRPFEFFDPHTVDEAAGLLSKYGPKAKVLAGGVDLIPRMRKRIITPEYLISIKKIRALDYHDFEPSTGLRFGALTTLRSLDQSMDIRNNYPALYEAVHQIASLQVKTTATATGNLCVASPASDIAVALMALGGTLTIKGSEGERQLSIEHFYPELHQTALGQGELVTEVFIPGLPNGNGSAFLNLVRTKSDIAKVSVAVSLTAADNSCIDCRIVLGAVAPTPIRAKEAEETLKGKSLDSKAIEAAAQTAMKATKTITDLRSTAEYRRKMTSVLVRWALEKALERAKA